MPSSPTRIEVPADVKQRAEALREQLKLQPSIEEVLTEEELADAAPFYLEMRTCVSAMKSARLAAGLTLSQVAERTGLAVETLSRLETGMLTNPTWKTLGSYALAVGRRLSLTASLTDDR